VPSGYYKTRYIQDLSLVETVWAKIWLAILILTLLVLPHITGRYFIYLFNLVVLNAIAALGLNLLIGYTGQVSLANAAFLAIGAFVAGVTSVQLGWPFPLPVIAAGLVAFLVGILVGIPALRIKGLYLIMATMALHYITVYAFLRYQLTYFGYQGILFSRPTLGPLTLDTDREFYYVLVLVAFALVVFTINVLRTPVGRSFVAVRDNDIAASTVGVNVAMTKILAFGLSSLYVGVAGGLYGYYLGVATAENFTLHLAIDHVAMIIIGGMGSILGSILGAVFVTMLPHGIAIAGTALSELIPAAGAAMQNHIFEIRLGVFGIIIILVLLFKPEGLNGIWNDIRLYFRNWPYSY